jgi:release factor glutamine methyltransferase
MLAAACNSSRAAVISGLPRVDDGVREQFAAMVMRRVQREPLAYILRCKEFYSLVLEVTPAVLIPRPETETVVSTLLESIQDSADCRVIDIGTGSGAIALAIAENEPAATITATDLSAEALAVARHNAARPGLASRVRFRLADCFEPLDGMGPLGRFQFVVSNPPYVCDDQIAGLTPEIRDYEPRLALAGGRDGLELYRRLAAQLPDHLDQNGCAIVEIGADQASAVTAIMHGAGATRVRAVRDLAGASRVVVAHFHEE